MGTVASSAYVAPGAYLVGDVTLGDDVGVWPCAVLRGDFAPISVGARSNIQDGAVLHTGVGFPVVIGEGVAIGHNAVIHGCTVEDGCVIGMGAILLNGAVVRRGAFVAAGALVPEGAEIPAGMLAVGSPARVRRPVGENELNFMRSNTALYLELARNARVAAENT